MLLRKLQLELEWEPFPPYDILKPEWKYDVFEDWTKEEIEKVAIKTHDSEDYDEDIRVRTVEMTQRKM
jgi:hypothetical protein